MNPQPNPDQQAGPPPAEPARRRYGCQIALLVVVLLIVLVPFLGIIWDGGFSNEEYRLTFTRPDGRPVEGVSLRVLTKAGGVSYAYPVNEFLPDATPMSDAAGLVIFHHVGNGLEFGGREYSNLLGMRLGETDAPQYVCAFFLGDREVVRVPFDDLRLRRERDQAPRIARKWRFSDWAMQEYLAHGDKWEKREMELFDGNGDGRLDREERVASGNALRLAERYHVSVPDKTVTPKEEEIEFAVRERTIVIDVP